MNNFSTLFHYNILYQKMREDEKMRSHYITVRSRYIFMVLVNYNVILIYFNFLYF